MPSARVPYLGLKALGAGEKVISNAVIVIICLLVGATFVHDDADIARLTNSDWQYVVPIFNLAVFVFGAQVLVPKLVRGNLDTSKRVPGLIIAGMSATVLLTAVLPASVITLSGVGEVSTVATFSWGRSLCTWAEYTAKIFALLAMPTSYWGLGGALFNDIFDHFRLGDETAVKKRLLVLVLALVTIPLLNLLFGQGSLVNALYFAGTFGGVIMEIIPIALLTLSRRHGDQELALKWTWYAHPIIQTFIVVRFLSSAIYAIASVLGLFPLSW